MVNAGITPINEYATPVTPPDNDLEFFSANFNYTTRPFSWGMNFTSPGSLLPETGWTPYIKWTGWILPSQYRYPPANFTIPPAAIEYVPPTALDFIIYDYMNASFRNFGPNSKAQFIIGIINNTTGQIFTYLTTEETVPEI